MLSLLVIHIIISVICAWTGFCFYNFVIKSPVEKPIIFYAITGLVCLTGISQVAILFVPLTIYLRALFLILPLASILIYRKQFLKFCRQAADEIASLSLLSRLFLLIVWLIILLINAGPAIMDDTESYHIQSIKWIQEYGTVPGLVNLHERYGFNSSWFSSVALFCFSGKFSAGFTVLNSVLSAWLSYWFLSKYEQLRKENNAYAAVAILLTFIVCVWVWPLTRGNAATANYDFITTSVALILFIEIVLSKEKEVSPSFEWIFWPLYLFTVRIINFPLLLLSLAALIFLIRQKNYRLIFLSVICCVLLLVPLVVRNIIIAGFPFYPATNLDLFNVDWKPDPQITQALQEYIKYFNRVATTYLSIEQTKALGSSWIPSWFKYLFLFDKIIVVAGSAGLLLGGLKLFTVKNSLRKRYVLPVATGFVWLIVWFLVAPDPRFVYGVLLFGIFLLCYQLMSILKVAEPIKAVSNFTMIILIIASCFYLFSKSWKQEEYRNWILPAKLPTPPTQQFTIDGIIFRIPERINGNWNPRCFGTKLPCLYEIHPKLRARGKTIQSGFHLEK